MKVNDDDGFELVSNILRMASTVRDDAVETAMRCVHHHNRQLPVAAVESVRRHPDLFLPIILQEVHDCIQWLIEPPEESEPDDVDSDLPFLAFVLTFERQWEPMVPLILDSLHLPGEAPFDLYGDVVHEYLSRFLAHFLADQPDRIETLIRDANANLYVRWAAGNAFAYLVRDQKMAADEAIQRLVKLFYDTRVVDVNGRAGMGHPYEPSAALLDQISQLGGASTDTIPNKDDVWQFMPLW